MAEGGHLRKVIRVRQAVAIYISSVLGAGILVIPGLAARTAGAGSLFAWVLLSLASYPLAYTFSRLSARRPESGGIYSFAKEAFGRNVGSMTAWLFVAWVVLGAPAITLAAGTYLAFAFPISGSGILWVAVGILVLAYGVNLKGIKLSGNVQVTVVGLILGVLAVGVLASISSVNVANFSPLLPGGITSVGVAAALIVWSYLGYENVSNVAEEFENPKRDFKKSVNISVLLIGVLYMSVSIAVVGTGSYATGGGVTPFAELMSRAFGASGGIAVSILAVVIIFSTVNAYTAGMGRVVYAAAADGNLPKFLAKIDPGSGVPRRALIALFVMIMLSLAGYYLFHVDVQSAFLATSGAAIMTYVIGAASGIKLLDIHGFGRILPWISLIVSVAIIPFIGPFLIASVPVAIVGFLYGRFFGNRVSMKKPES